MIDEQWLNVWTDLLIDEHWTVDRSIDRWTVVSMDGTDILIDWQWFVWTDLLIDEQWLNVWTDLLIDEQWLNVWTDLLIDEQWLNVWKGLLMEKKQNNSRLFPHIKTYLIDNFGKIANYEFYDEFYCEKKLKSQNLEKKSSRVAWSESRFRITNFSLNDNFYPLPHTPLFFKIKN